MKFTFLIASCRENGNSEQLARIAAGEHLGRHELTWLVLRDLPLAPFRDIRHDDEDYAFPVGNELVLFDATVSCDHLIFVTPVYWYSVPATLKLYLDYWSAWMRLDRGGFKKKMESKWLWAISASAGEASEAYSMFESLKLSAAYLSMNWGGYVLGNGSAAGDVLNDQAAVESARNLFAELK